MPDPEGLKGRCDETQPVQRIHVIGTITSSNREAVVRAVRFATAGQSLRSTFRAILRIRGDQGLLHDADLWGLILDGLGRVGEIAKQVGDDRSLSDAIAALPQDASEAAKRLTARPPCRAVLAALRVRDKYWAHQDLLPIREWVDRLEGTHYDAPFAITTEVGSLGTTAYPWAWLWWHSDLERQMSARTLADVEGLFDEFSALLGDSARLCSELAIALLKGAGLRLERSGPEA